MSNNLIPQDVGEFVPFRTLGGKYKIKKEYYQNSPIRIVILQDGRILVKKVSSGAVCLCESYQQAKGIRQAAMHRYNKIEWMMR